MRHYKSKFWLALGYAVLPFTTLAAPSAEEKLLALPTAKYAASTNECDQFYRVIVWPVRRQPGTAISIYLSQETPRLPERGFICLKIQKTDGTFWERSRALTLKEAKTIADLFVSEEIFSLSASPWLPAEHFRANGLASGPGVNYFTHIDKLRHRSKEVRRTIGVSHPAQRVIDGLLEVVRDYLETYDKDPKSPRGSWEAEEKASS